MKNLIQLFILLLLMLSGMIYGQEVPEGQEDVKKGFWTLHGLISLPQGDFGDDSGEKAGLATTGYGFSVEYTIPASSKNLFYVLQGHFILNSVDDTELKSLLGQMFPGYTIDLDMGNWINIPVMGGLRYQTPLSPTVNLYLVGKIGLNIVKGPSMDMTINGETGSSTYDMSTSFCLGVGGGIVIDEQINIGFKYLDLGEPELSGEVEAAGQSESLAGIDQPISMLVISLGYQF